MSGVSSKSGQCVWGGLEEWNEEVGSWDGGIDAGSR